MGELQGGLRVTSRESWWLQNVTSNGGCCGAGCLSRGQYESKRQRRGTDGRRRGGEGRGGRKTGAGETKDEGASNAVDKLTETWQAVCHSMVAHACNSNKLRQQDCCELESGIQSEFQASQSYIEKS